MHFKTSLFNDISYNYHYQVVYISYIESVLVSSEACEVPFNFYFALTFYIRQR